MDAEVAGAKAPRDTSIALHSSPASTPPIASPSLPITTAMATPVTANTGTIGSLVLQLGHPLPKPPYEINVDGVVMTNMQLDTLKRQISVFSTISQQLIAMYHAMTAHIPGTVWCPTYGYDSSQQAALTPQAPKVRQRWTPQPAQLQLLEKYFMQLTGTPNKSKIKEITMELAQHGPITESNVYNWFQNKKARTKRKHSNSGNGTDKEGEGDEGEEEGDGGDKKARVESDGNEEDAEEMCHEGGELEESANVDSLHLHQKHQSHSGIEALDRNGSGVLPPVSDPSTAAYAPAVYSQADTQPTMQVMIDGKSWDVPLGLLDVRTSFGESSVLKDANGQVVVTNEDGITLQPLQQGMCYTLQRVEAPISEQIPTCA